MTRRRYQLLAAVPSARPAFTMIEMVTSCLILSLLMLALGYGLKLALVSTGAGAAQAATSREAVEVAERVTDDLNEAMNFTERTAESVTFTVPDRGPDPAPGGPPADPDVIRYKWWPTGGTITTTAGGGGGLIGGVLGVLSGPTAAATFTVPQYVLTRQVNDGPTSVLARDVRQFRLDYLYRSMSPPPPPPGDRFLWKHEPDVPEGTAMESPVSNAVWTGETFRVPPSVMSGGATSYAITRIALLLHSDVAVDGLVRVKVFQADSVTHLPNTGQLLDEAFVPEASLTASSGWAQVRFSKLTNLNPAMEYCVLVVGEGSTANHGAIGFYRYLLAPIIEPLPANTYWVQTSNSGMSWTVPDSLRSLRYKVYGTTSQ